MNLTFFPSSGQKEKSNIFLNYKKNAILNKSLFPSIFSHFETETKHLEEISPKPQKNKIKLPYYKNIKTEMLQMKRQINSLFGINNIFKQMRSRYNSICYKNFVKGFAKYFFGPFGYVTKRNKLLREYYLSKGNLSDKIYAGKLDYYDYTSKKLNQVTARQNETKKRRLSLSTNFAVVFDKNDVYSVKAVTSKRLVNYKKNFVDINKRKYLDSDLEPIKEIENNSKKDNKNKLNQKKKIQIRLNTYNKFNKEKNDEKLKRKTFSFITQNHINLNNKELSKSTIPKFHKSPLINLKFNNIKHINKKSYLFLTQSNFNTKI